MKPVAAEPTNRQQQREQTRTQILQSAVKVFARAGFEAASLADIAADAGVKKALVQYHFSTKEQLWKDAAGHLWHGRNAHLYQLLGDDCDNDPGDRMRKGFTALVEYTRENPQWLWFMFHEAAANGSRLQWLSDNHLRQDYELGEKFILAFQQRGLIKSGSPLHLLHLISGALTYNLLVAPHTQLATGVDLSSEASIAQQVALLQSLLSPQPG